VAPGGRFELPGPRGPHALKGTLKEFERFCTIDLALSDATVKGHHIPEMRRFFKWLGNREVTTESIREYLETLKEKAASTRANTLKTFRRFFRDYLKHGELVATFKLPHQNYKPKSIPIKEQLQKFYAALKSPKDRAIFLIYATTGLRKHELVSLALKEIDLERRIILPKTDGSRTKRTWATFFNEEAERALRECFGRCKGLTSDSKLFAEKAVRKTFKRGQERAGIHITPKVLRDWFCSEMGELGVADRYVDAFCGRVPRSILARHYTDFSPERLKRIYDSVRLRVLE